MKRLSGEDRGPKEGVEENATAKEWKTDRAGSNRAGRDNTRYREGRETQMK